MLPDTFTTQINTNAPEILAFSVVRNEMLRLPAWLNHYREAGVHCFAVIDNGSTDGTFEYLAAQDDVILTRTTDSYNASNFGMHWLNELLGRLTKPTWVKYTDADELMIYRGWPERPLIDLCREAYTLNKNAIFAFMLDMYPDGNISGMRADPNTELFNDAPCFDRDYHFRFRPIKPWEKPRKVLEIIGGPRIRLLSNFHRECRTTWFSYFLRGQIDRVIDRVPPTLVPLLVQLMPKQMPSLCKVPLVLSGQDIQYHNAHDVQSAVFADENVVLCHFKFLHDFEQRVRTEAARGEHFRRGAEYIMYAKELSKYDKLDLRYSGSCHFEGADQLISLGMIRDLRSFLNPTH